MKADTLAMLVFLSRQGDEGFEKAAYVSWLGASSEGIRPPPRAAGRATLHKLSASLRQEHASGRRPDPAQLALPLLLRGRLAMAFANPTAGWLSLYARNST